MSRIRKSDFVVQDGPFRSVDDDAIGRLAKDRAAMRQADERSARRAQRLARLSIASLVRLAQTPLTIPRSQSSATS